MIDAFVVSAALAAGLRSDIQCSFRGVEKDPGTVTLTVDPRPSLKDRPGLYRVMIAVEGRRIRGHAQPLHSTEERDVLIRARTATNSVYSLGIRDDGAAAFFVAEGKGDGLTFVGRCKYHERWLSDWVDGRR